jgi:hypothetical protein
MRHGNLRQGKARSVKHGEQGTLKPEDRQDVAEIRIRLIQANDGLVWAASDHHDSIGMLSGVRGDLLG